MDISQLIRAQEVKSMKDRGIPPRDSGTAMTGGRQIDQ
jgi:hypothetical protein